MNITVCLLANTIYYLEGGGHFWIYLNWALGLRALGCRVIWMEAVRPSDPVHEIQALVATLKSRLVRYGFADAVALCTRTSEPLSSALVKECLDLEAASEADFLLNLAYAMPSEVLGRFRRSVFVDIDPGLTQVWMSQGMQVARHSVYFTIGEGVGQPGALFPDCGVQWHYTPPPVCLQAWSCTPADATAPYTTVTHWGDSWIQFQGEIYPNGKREGFLPLLDLPRHTPQPLELAVFLKGYEYEHALLAERGWRVCDAHAVASTPWDYQHYVQRSRGEFSCAKPFYVKLQSTWVSDRTLCYLASGKPAVVQYTGPSRILPEAGGLVRFRSLEDAARALAMVEADHERHCRLARQLTEEYFDAQKVVGRIVEVALA